MIKPLKSLLSILKDDLSATKRGIKTSALRSKNHSKTLGYVLSQPINLIYGLLGGLVSIAVAVWLANVQIIQQLFASPTLSASDRIEFLFEIFAPTFRNIAALQLVLIVMFGLGSVVVWASWIEALKLQHDNEKHREAFAPLLLASLVGAAIGIVGVSLVTPVITREGLSVFVSNHYSGTIVLLLGTIMQVKIAHLFMHRLFPIAEKTPTY